MLEVNSETAGSCQTDTFFNKLEFVRGHSNANSRNERLNVKFDDE